MCYVGTVKWNYFLPAVQMVAGCSMMYLHIIVTIMNSCSSMACFLKKTHIFFSSSMLLGPMQSLFFTIPSEGWPKLAKED
jgi:hypothetical protein